jgi:hypothetical protein
MAEPKTIDELVDPLHAAFPHVARTQIEQDVRDLLKDLMAKRLVFTGSEERGMRRSVS